MAQRRRITIDIPDDVWRAVQNSRASLPIGKFIRDMLLLGMATKMGSMDPSQNDKADQSLTRTVVEKLSIQALFDHQTDRINERLRHLEDMIVTMPTAVARPIYETVGRTIKVTFDELIGSQLGPLLIELRKDIASGSTHLGALEGTVSTLVERLQETVSSLEETFETASRQQADRIQEELDGVVGAIARDRASTDRLIEDLTNAVLIGFEKTYAGSRTTLTQTVSQLGQLMIASRLMTLYHLDPTRQTVHKTASASDNAELLELVSDLRKAHIRVIDETERALADAFALDRLKRTMRNIAEGTLTTAGA